MIVYHGSDSNFKRLRIAKELVKNSSTMLNEGMGIYFFTNKEQTQSYGKYLYVLEINDRCLADFRNPKVCENYYESILSMVMSKFDLNIRNYFRELDISSMLSSGRLSINYLGSEMADILDSKYEFYNSTTETEREKIYRALRKFGKDNLKAYMFPYHLENVGVIKDVSDNVVRIIDKQKRY